MTDFKKNTIVFSKASNPLPPNKSSEVVVFFDGQTLKTIDFAGLIKPLASPSAVTVVQTTDKEALQAVEQKLTKLVDSTQADLQSNIVEALVALEDLKKRQASADATTQAKIFSLEQSLTKSLVETANSVDNQVTDLEKNTSKELKSLDKQVSQVEKSVSELTDATISNSDSISGLSKNVQTLIKNFNSSVNLKVSKQELHEAIKAVKAVIPPEVEVVAGEVTHGTKDDLSVRQVDNKFIIDLELKKQKKDGTTHVGGGVSQDWVTKYVTDVLKNYTPTNINIVGTGGISVSLSGSTYYIDGSQISGGGGSSISNLTSIDGSVVITPISGGFDLSVTPAIISGGSTVFFGSVDLNDTDTEYTINHVSVDTASSIPVVSVESPTNFYRYRIFDRASTSFKVALDATAAATDKILWHLASGTAEIGDYLVTESGDFLVDESGSKLEYA